MTWQELPVWCKIRMLINQKIQNNITDPSIFINRPTADKKSNGFNFADSCEDVKEKFRWWYNLLNGNDPTINSLEDPLNSKLYIYESTPGKYGLKMSHSDTYLYFTKQELSDLGLINPIVEPKNSRKYHTFEEHLNNKPSNRDKWIAFIKYLQNKKWKEDKTDWDLFCTRFREKHKIELIAKSWLDDVQYLSGEEMVEYSIPDECYKYWKLEVNKFETNVREVATTGDINPECLAFKEWALKEESAVTGKSLWDIFVQNTEDLTKVPFNEKYWMEECNKRYTGYYILTSFTVKSLHAYWKEVYKLFQSQKKSPAEIFIEWAFTKKYPFPNYCATIGDWYLKKCNSNCDKRTFITKYKHSSLETIYIDALVNPNNYDSEWVKEIEKKWQNYLKTINNDNKNQLQRKEIPVSEGTGRSRPGIYLEGDIIEPSRGYRVNGKGCEIFGEKISISKAGLSFGHNCSLSM